MSALEKNNMMPNVRNDDVQLVAYILKAFPFNAYSPALEPFDDAAWTELVKRARYQGVLPLLSKALEQIGWQNVPSFAQQELVELNRSSALATATAYHELVPLLAEFQTASIPLIILKGACLAKWLYPSQALRPFSDLDFLIHKADVTKATSVLMRRGYMPSDELARGFRSTYYSEMSFYKKSVPRTAVDLHWNLFVPLFYRRRMPLEWFWQHVQEFDFGGGRAFIFEPTAQLVHLAVHASLNHQNSPRLIWLYDLALLLTQYSDAIDWQAAVEYTRAARLGMSVYTILTDTVETWQLTLAPELVAAFYPPNPSWSERLAFRLTGAPRNESRVLSDALGAPGVLPKLEYILRHLFPDPAFLRKRYGFNNSLWLPYYYARRVVESSGKALRSIRSALMH